ncbi:MAG TPA: histidine--tRNA ligase, partial [bacterium]|nr:histidine--tRNA ligase [bacterium]
FKRADKSGAAFALILGEDEVKQGCAQIKPLRHEGVQVAVAFDVLADYLTKCLF